MSGSWTALTSAPAARNNAAFVGHDGLLSLLGGSSGGDPAPAVDAYDYTIAAEPTSPWAVGAAGPGVGFYEVQGASAWIEGELHLIAYGPGATSTTLTPRAWNPSSGWRAGTSTTISLNGNKTGGTYWNGYFWVVTRGVWKSYNPRTDAWANFTSTERPDVTLDVLTEYPTVVGFRDRLHVIGGGRDTTTATLAKHHSIDPFAGTPTWDTKADYGGGARRSLLSTAAGNRYVFAGFGTQVAGNQVDFWMFDGTSWTAKAVGPTSDAGQDARLTFYRRAVYAWNLGGQQLHRWNPDVSFPSDPDQFEEGWGIHI